MLSGTYDIDTYYIHCRHSVFKHCAGKGRPAGQYVYVAYTYTYASLYVSSYLYNILLERLISYM